MKQDKLIKDALPVKKTKKDALPVKKTKNYKIKELSQNNLIKNSEYKDELIEERIKKLVEIAKRTIKNRIFDEDKRIASNLEIENIYKKRLNIYENSISKLSKGIATGGPISKQIILQHILVEEGH